jgi:hypothetical protein
MVFQKLLIHTLFITTVYTRKMYFYMELCECFRVKGNFAEAKSPRLHLKISQEKEKFKNVENSPVLIEKIIIKFYRP